MKNVFSSVIIVATLSSPVPSMAESVTPVQLDKNLQQYSWYQALKGNNKTAYNTRASVAQFLEYKWLYQAQNTQYCKDDKTDVFHDKNTDTCYIGQPNQNASLLQTLQSDRVRKLLWQSSAWDIANGWPERPLSVNRLYQKYMTEYSTTKSPHTLKYANEWKQRADEENSLPKNKK